MHVAVQPCGNLPAQLNYIKTIDNLVNAERLKKHLKPSEYDSMLASCGENFNVWGVLKGHQKKWESLNPGDFVIFYKSGKFILKAKISYKVRSFSAAKEIWGMYDENETWECLYFLDGLELIDLPVREYNKAMGYKLNNVVQGFDVFREEKAQALAELLAIPEDDLSDGEQASMSSDFLKLSLAEQLKNINSLDVSYKRKSRVEMGIFRRHLFSNNAVGRCAICGGNFPTGLLIAAHIKKRAKCDDEQKRDLNVVMPACKLGCDALFEDGYIVVGDSGDIEIGSKLKKITSGLSEKVTFLIGKKCEAFKKNTTAPYFDWHRRYHAGI
ncbi:hypothetical protein CTTA_4394 [Comamonas testosteroni]|uniref:HNH nuclease domain-containing protein n=1 Tax=Comamonas testosteroni TaxID=285 RepID=A0A5A7MKH3_COMTE|nr:hypothetical protein [Comamonas testosteroni]GEQ77389.1 hypothetical protein CTTA_4394 [Comamonas testosteroni]